MLFLLIANSAPSMRTRANTTHSPETLSETTTLLRRPTRMKTSEPDAKRPIWMPPPQQVKLLDYIGK